MMKRLKISFFVASAVSLCIISLLLPGCGKKTKEQAETRPVPGGSSAQLIETIKPEALLKETGFPTYPFSEILDKSVKSNRVSVPEEGGSGTSYYETVVSSFWLATKDPVEKVRGYYVKQAPYTLSEQKQGEDITFLQLCSAKSIDQSIKDKVSPLFLINIHKKRLTEAEKGAYSNELRSLKDLNRPDTIQKKRIHEIERLLAEKTLIQLNIRKLLTTA